VFLLDYVISVDLNFGITSVGMNYSRRSTVIALCASRLLQKSKSKFRSQLDKTFPAVITLHRTHDHSHNIAAVLKMLDNTAQKLIDLFH